MTGPRLTARLGHLRALGLFVDDLVVGLLDDLLVGRGAVAAVATRRSGGRLLLGLDALVDGLGELVRSLHEVLRLRADRRGVVAVERRLHVLELGLDLGDRGLVERLTVLLEALL